MRDRLVARSPKQKLKRRSCHAELGRYFSDHRPDRRLLGFGGIAGASVEIAKIIFFIAVILFLISAVVGLARGRTRV
jgi:uncharacterized membrane protein YtjA (UPF0391 family)